MEINCTQKRAKCSKENGKYRNWRYLINLTICIHNELLFIDMFERKWKKQNFLKLVLNKSKKGITAIYGIELSSDDIKKIDPKPFNNFIAFFYFQIFQFKCFLFLPISIYFLIWKFKYFKVQIE
ncbi:hypothetical protein RFI_33147 [Reticulomyxa filosa]|uniref:Uncharacterized protein n=1 Tax=Reticulomyxa filosa TaxID=46433 RepID=X6LS86_RETFI|nr:hypothetical protein RFI_33147 [Reticulomyxa filosa]|eukprot:ETO04251.1 hypothetical protein RFI_33147 [Reticulomyxa filosa]